MNLNGGGEAFHLASFSLSERRRSAFPSPPLKLPFPMGPSPHLDLTRRNHFNLVQSTVYCLPPLKKMSGTCKTAKCWLIKIQEIKDPGKVLLTDPLSRFYSNSSLSPRLPKRLNQLEYVGTGEIPKLRDPEFLCLNANKVGVCSEGAAFAVMAIHSCSKSSIWRKGDKKWTDISNGRDSGRYVDVVYHNGKFYAVDDSALTTSVDLSLNDTLIDPPKPRSGDGRCG